MPQQFFLMLKYTDNFCDSFSSERRQPFFSVWQLKKSYFFSEDHFFVDNFAMMLMRGFRKVVLESLNAAFPLKAALWHRSCLTEKNRYDFALTFVINSYGNKTFFFICFRHQRKNLHSTLASKKRSESLMELVVVRSVDCQQILLEKFKISGSVETSACDTRTEEIVKILSEEFGVSEK